MPSSGGAPAQPRDYRRAAMIWMLVQAGGRWADIARGMGISVSRTRELGTMYAGRLERRMRIGYSVEPWAKRLRSAGAILDVDVPAGARRAVLDGSLPPMA